MERRGRLRIMSQTQYIGTRQMSSIPMTLTYRHIDRSGALEERARKLGSRLGRFSDRIMQCHMVLEGPGNGHHGAAPYVVTIELTVRGAHIHADSLHGDGGGHKDIYL